MPTSGSRHPLPAWNHSDRLAKNEKKQTRLETWTSNTETLTSFWNCPALPCPALPCPAPPCPALPCCPALPLPLPLALPSALPTALPCPAHPALPSRSSHFQQPDRRPGCLLETLAFRRAAGTGREDPQPAPIHISSAWLCDVVVYASNGEKEQRARKPPFRGVWGVNPKPELRIVGVVGAGLHADASAR